MRSRIPSLFCLAAKHALHECNESLFLVMESLFLVMRDLIDNLGIMDYGHLNMRVLPDQSR